MEGYALDETRACSRCDLPTPLDRFTGGRSYCDVCLADADRKRRYGLSRERYEELLEQTGGVCQICLGEGLSVHVDHDHSSGLVRGLLCPRCNLGLGHFNDSKTTLARAITYLRNETTH